MGQFGLGVSRFFRGRASRQQTTRLQAIQPYPYHPGLEVHTLGNDFPVHSFPDLLCSRLRFPLAVSQVTS